MLRGESFTDDGGIDIHDLDHYRHSILGVKVRKGKHFV